MTDIYNALETESETNPAPENDIKNTMVPKKVKRTIKDVKEGEVREDMDEIVIRQSYLLLGFRLAVSLILLVFLYIAFVLLSKLLSAFGIFIYPGTNPVLLLIVILVFGLVGLVTFLKWKATYYTLKKESLEFTTGIAESVTRTLRLDTFAGITIEQGMLGKILNYGTIQLEYQAKEGSTEHLTFFPNPEHYGEIIKERIKSV